MSFLSGLVSSVTPARLGLRWLRQIPGLLRVAIFDPQHSDRAFIIAYEEKRRSYTARAVMITSGEPLWEREVPNGGYGSPVAVAGLFICLSGFSDVTALDGDTGTIVWSYTTSCRIRSSLNQIFGLTVFSSGGEILGVDRQGSLQLRASFPGHFFFGICTEGPNRTILTLGVGPSHLGQNLALYSFSETGDLLWLRELGLGEIASSDTSGVWCNQGVAFVGGTHSINAVDARLGSILWSVDAPRLTHRSIITGDERRVYATSVEGVLTACHRRTGEILWQRNLSSDGLYMPATVAGDRLLIEADGMLQVIDSESGSLLQEAAVGHAPYSCCAVRQDLMLLGGGDPPYFGLLLAFDLKSNNSMRCYFEKESFTLQEGDSLELALTVQTNETILSVELDLSSLGGERRATPRGRFGNTFVFTTRANAGRNWGVYALPVRVANNENTAISTVRLSLSEINELPPRILLNNVTVRKQEREDYSGASCMQALRALHGVDVEQQDMREMVDAIIAHSPGYTPFQIWRIVTRRALQTRAKIVSDLPEFRDLLRKD